MTTQERIIAYQQDYAERYLTLKRHGDAPAPRGQQTREIIAFQYNFAAPDRGGFTWDEMAILHPARKQRVEYLFAEALYFWCGIGDDSLFRFSQAAAKSFSGASEYGGRLRAGMNHPRAIDLIDDPAHGIRPIDQIREALLRLYVDPDSRQAIMDIHQPADIEYPHDTPCTLNVQWLVRQGYLHQITTMRSNDLYLGHSLDVFNNRVWQTFAAWVLGLKVGMLQWNVGSMHYYTRDEDKLMAIAEEPDTVCPTRLEAFVTLAQRMDLEVLQELEMPNVRERLVLLDGWAEDFYRTIVRV